MKKTSVTKKTVTTTVVSGKSGEKKVSTTTTTTITKSGSSESKTVTVTKEEKKEVPSAPAKIAAGKKTTVTKTGSVEKKIAAPKEVVKSGLPAKTTPAESEALAKQVLEEQNSARTDPRKYALKVEEILGYFSGNVIHFPGNPVGLMTKEGPAVYKEAIEFLKKQTPLQPLKWSPGLGKAAYDHSLDIGAHGIVGHTGSNGSTMTSRMEKYGSWSTTVGENVSFGCDTASRIVIQLLVDDGVSSRGHRNNMFSTAFKMCGIGIAPHKTYKTCCTLDYAGGFTEKGTK